MLGLESLLVTVLGQLTRGIVGRAREIMRGRDRSREFDSRQQLLHTLKEKEAKLQSEQRRAEREVNSILTERQARRDHDRAVDLVRFQAMASVESQRATLRDQRMLDKTPFHWDRDQVRGLLDEKLRDGRPLLLMAPFYNDARAGVTFDVALRRTWESLPWADNLTSFAGLFQRPLDQADVDLMIIRDTLQERPAVLIHGDVQAGRRVWTSLLGFGLIAGGPNDVLKVNLPKLVLPGPGAGDDDMLSFQDQLADLCGTVAGVFGDWYHLLHGGRTPRVHLQCEDDGLRRSLGAALAGAYEVAAAQGQLGRLEAGLAQARVLAESGLGHAAVAMASALPQTEIVRDRRLRQEWDDLAELTGHDLRLPHLAAQPARPDTDERDRTLAEKSAEFWLG